MNLCSAHFQSSVIMLFEKTIWQVALRDRSSQVDVRAGKFSYGCHDARQSLLRDYQSKDLCGVT